MPIRRLLLVAVAALLLACDAAGAASSGTRGLTLRASFPSGARLGGESPLRLGLTIDPHVLSSPVRELRLRFPASLGLATSGLGASICRRAPSDFEKVMVRGRGLAGCSPNAVMGRGNARAEIRLGSSVRSEAVVIPELARIAMLAGPIEQERFGLVFLANGIRPFGVTLVFGGHIEPAPAPWGGTLVLGFRPVPNAFEAEVALLAIAFEIGAPEIRYRERRAGRTVTYRPEGIVLPPTCPRGGGFPFSADLAFHDGSRARARTLIRCPR